jgi:hypothetical protein
LVDLPHVAELSGPVLPIDLALALKDAEYIDPQMFESQKPTKVDGILYGPGKTFRYGVLELEPLLVLGVELHFLISPPAIAEG